jgi:hypothetical protein
MARAALDMAMRRMIELRVREPRRRHAGRQDIGPPAVLRCIPCRDKLVALGTLRRGCSERLGTLLQHVLTQLLREILSQRPARNEWRVSAFIPGRRFGLTPASPLLQEQSIDRQCQSLGR